MKHAKLTYICKSKHETDTKSNNIIFTPLQAPTLETQRPARAPEGTDNYGINQAVELSNRFGNDDEATPAQSSTSVSIYKHYLNAHTACMLLVLKPKTLFSFIQSHNI